MNFQKLATDLRALTRIDGQRLRDVMGRDDVQRLAETLGVDIEDKEEFECDALHMEQMESRLKDREKLEVENATLIDLVRGLSGASSAVGIIGATITLRSGKIFDYLSPTADMIDIEDIAWGLAKEGRYANQLPGALEFSVCQHSCIIHDHAEPEDRLAALMHDSPEYVVKDIPKPLKMIIGPGYGAVEKRVWIAIASKFNLPLNLSHRIKALDWRMLNTEKKFLMTNDKRDDWNGLNDYPPFEDMVAADFCPWTVEHAASEFLRRFHALQPWLTPK